MCLCLCVYLGGCSAKVGGREGEDRGRRNEVEDPLSLHVFKSVFLELGAASQ